MVDFTIGYNLSAEEEPNGINRAIVENLADKLETIIEKTVVIGLSGLSIDPITLPPLYDASLRIWTSSI